MRAGMHSVQPPLLLRLLIVLSFIPLLTLPPYLLSLSPMKVQSECGKATTIENKTKLRSHVVALCPATHRAAGQLAADQRGLLLGS
jgi:hypothetical protein